MVDGDRGAAFSCQFHIDFGCSMGPLPEGRVWYYWHDGAPSGPATLDELVDLLRRRILAPDTPIRHPGMADFQPARLALEPLRGKYRPAAPAAAPPARSAAGTQPPASARPPAPADVRPAAPTHPADAAPGAAAAPAVPPRPAATDTTARTAPADVRPAAPHRPAEAAPGSAVPPAPRVSPAPAPPTEVGTESENPRTAPVAEGSPSRLDGLTSAPPAVAVPDDVPAPRVTPDRPADATEPAASAERLTRFEPIDTTERVPPAGSVVDRAPVVAATTVPTYEPVRDAHGDLRAEYVEPVETVVHAEPGEHGQTASPTTSDLVEPDHGRHDGIDPKSSGEAAHGRPADSDWVASVAPATSATHVSVVEPAVPARHVFAVGSVAAAIPVLPADNGVDDPPAAPRDDLDVEVVSGESSPAPAARPKSRAGWYGLAALVIIGLVGWMAYPYAGGLMARAGATQPGKAAPAAAPAAARPSGADVTILLPHGVSMQVPNDWLRVNDDGRAAGGKAGAATPQPDTIDARGDTVYAANRYDEKSEPIGILNAGFYPEEVTQQEVVNSSDKDILALDSLLRARIEKSTNGTLIGWTGTRRTMLNGLTALVSEYRRQSSATVFRVRLVRVFDAAQSFTVAVAYREDRADVLKPVTDSIIARIGRRP